MTNARNRPTFSGVKKRQKPKEVDERAGRSGLGAKLRAYFAWAKEQKATRQPGWRALHRNANQVAKWISEERGLARGDTVSSVTVKTWEDGTRYPGAKCVGYLEELLGDVWSWIDDPDTEWRPDDRRRVIYNDLRVAGFSSAEMARAESRAAAEARAATSRRASRA